jgi:hypothetical protein
MAGTINIFDAHVNNLKVVDGKISSAIRIGSRSERHSSGAKRGNASAAYQVNLCQFYRMFTRCVEGELRPAFLRELQVHTRACEIGHVAGRVIGDIVAG